MKLVLVTGMSGAGKSIALKTLEDCGFEAIDNMPLSFLPAVSHSAASPRHLAVGSDVRSRDFSVEHFLHAIKPLKKNSAIDFHLLFLDCDDEVLRRRFTETRRRHPLLQDRPIMDGIAHERALISGLKDIADLVLDTSDLQAAELRKIIAAHFARDERKLSVALTSFSFKRGIPREADMVFDARFLKNPHYESALKLLDGLDEKVAAHVESDRDFARFFASLEQLLLPLLPRYLEEGKQYLTVAIGCTGGQHRSVHVSHKLEGLLRQHGYDVTLRHRDLSTSLSHYHP